MSGNGRTPGGHRVVLVGGGHAHVQVMTALARAPVPGLGLTLVTDRLATPYSGMLPGHIAGLYRRDEMHIDLARLATATGTSLVEAAATSIDLDAHAVGLADGRTVPYDMLSLDVGITPDLSAIAGADRHAVAVKPISRLLERLDAALAHRPACVAVVGGGAAGVELACALRAYLGPAPSISLLAASHLVPTMNAGVRRRAEAALARLGIAVEHGFRAASIDEGGVTSASGRRVPADLVLVSTAARAPGWLAESRLPVTSDGSVRIRPTLQVEGHDAVFAVGDCATRSDDPREKAGVYAVRQGPVLAGNIARRASGKPLREHKAQHAALAILASGDGRAIAGRGTWFAVEGGWVWRWKDRIDRRFMAMFSDFRA